MFPSQSMVLLCMLFIASYGTLTEAAPDTNNDKKVTDEKLHEVEAYHPTKESGDGLKDDNKSKLNTESEGEGEEESDVEQEIQQQNKGATTVQSKSGEALPSKTETIPVSQTTKEDKKETTGVPSKIKANPVSQTTKVDKKEITGVNTKEPNIPAAEKNSGAIKNSKEKPKEVNIKVISNNDKDLDQAKTGAEVINTATKPDKKPGMLSKVTHSLPLINKTPKPSEKTNPQAIDGKKISEPPRANDNLQSESDKPATGKDKTSKEEDESHSKTDKKKGTSKGEEKPGMLAKLKKTLSKKPSDNSLEKNPSQDGIDTVATTDTKKNEKKPGMIQKIKSTLRLPGSSSSNKEELPKEQQKT